MPQSRQIRQQRQPPLLGGFLLEHLAEANHVADVRPRLMTQTADEVRPDQAGIDPDLVRAGVARSS